MKLNVELNFLLEECPGLSKIEMLAQTAHLQEQQSCPEPHLGLPAPPAGQTCPCPCCFRMSLPDLLCPQPAGNLESCVIH